MALILLVIGIDDIYAAQDTEKPVIESIEVLTPVVSQGDKVRIKVKVSDDLAGVRSINVVFHSTDKTGVVFHTWVPEGSPLKGEYILEVELNKYAELGKWKANIAEVRDFAEKSNYYDAFGFGADPTPLINVSFEVVEKSTVIPPPVVDDGFKPLTPKTGVAIDKEFTVTFNLNVAIKTLTEGNIYVLDSSGNKIPVMFIIDRKTDKSSSEVTIAPINSYRPKTTYTLYVKDVYSTTGKQLKQNTKMEFTTK